MHIREDKTYISQLDLKLIEKGYSELKCRSVNLEKTYSNEQGLKNRALFEKSSKEERIEIQNKEGELFSRKICAISEQLNKEFVMYQYKKDRKDLPFGTDAWELFYYSNKGWNNKDYPDFVRLSFNERKSYEEMDADYERLLKSIKNQSIDDEVTIKLHMYARGNKEKIKIEALVFLQGKTNKFFVWNGSIGKIKEVPFDTGEVAYGFFEKNAKKKYWKLSYEQILEMAWEKAIG